MTPEEIKERKALELAHIRFGVKVDRFYASVGTWSNRGKGFLGTAFTEGIEYRLHQPKGEPNDPQRT